MPTDGKWGLIRENDSNCKRFGRIGRKPPGGVFSLTQPVYIGYFPGSF